MANFSLFQAKICKKLGLNYKLTGNLQMQHICQVEIIDKNTTFIINYHVSVAIPTSNYQSLKEQMKLQKPCKKLTKRRKNTNPMIQTFQHNPKRSQTSIQMKQAIDSIHQQIIQNEIFVIQKKDKG
ncbi:Hypothetical_protein [Hexamita inflata]|uniref:Hypothetical_protein n=1 Tax=Hexamita inflata TaxID=28002 RepID=A0AA86P430_9EUKA|nr:Hypothetical protein HINF_LOCUS18650 [Hexamita inflata]